MIVHPSRDRCLGTLPQAPVVPRQKLKFVALSEQPQVAFTETTIMIKLAVRSGSSDSESSKLSIKRQRL